MRFARALFCIAIVTASAACIPAHAQFPIIRTSNSNLAEYGKAVAGIGDLNGDGHSDFVVGNPSANSAIVFSGASAGGVILTLTGSSGASGFGAAIGRAGDVDADGIEDIIVGAPGLTAIFAQGRARIFSGATGSVIHEFASAVLADRFGAAVAGIGDVNADGFGDVAVGMPFAGAGAVRAYSGIDGAPIWLKTGNATGANFGTAIASLGDINGDGIADLVVGAPAITTTSGSISVLDGSAGTVVYSVTGTDAQGRFGASVACIGDLTGDGKAEFIVGSPFATVSQTRSGRASVLSGGNGAILLTVNGSSFNEQLGAAVAGGGDLNGDGLPDFAAGSPFAAGFGRVTAYSGWNGAPLKVFFGNSPGSRYGAALADAGDVNGDKFADLIIGAPGDGGAPAGNTEVVVLCGADEYAPAASTGLTLRWTPNGPTPDLGTVSVSGAGSFGVGMIAASFDVSSISIGAPTVVIDPSQLIAIVYFGYDANGELLAPVSIAGTFLGTAAFYLQAFTYDFISATVTGSSNGLAIQPTL